MIIPGVQKPHWRPCFSQNAFWSGCRAPSPPAMPSIVVTLVPSACDGEDRAALHRAAVDVDGAGAALAGVAADVGAGEARGPRGAPGRGAVAARRPPPWVRRSPRARRATRPPGRPPSGWSGNGAGQRARRVAGGGSPSRAGRCDAQGTGTPMVAGSRDGCNPVSARGRRRASASRRAGDRRSGASGRPSAKIGPRIDARGRRPRRAGGRRAPPRDRGRRAPRGPRRGSRPAERRPVREARRARGPRPFADAA